MAETAALPRPALRLDGHRPRVVVVGGGFGGLEAAKALGRAPVDVTVLDRVNYNLFQPLLYQVAMAGLSPAEIATPIRAILRKHENTRVLLAEVVHADLAARRLRFKDGEELTYDYLVLAVGARSNFFGHDDWERRSLGMKAIEEALEIRRRVLLAYEEAERTPSVEARRELLSFVVIGGGPTGVELAGALAELSRRVLTSDFRVVRPGEAKVTLLEGGPRLLTAFDPRLSDKARQGLRELGVDVHLGTQVLDVRERSVRVKVQGDTLQQKERDIPASCIIWAAGVRGVSLMDAVDAVRDRQGRLIVGQDCALPSHPEVFVIGDAAAFTQDGALLPGMAPVAMQQGQYAARTIAGDLGGEERQPFRYFDKGIMATIGRSRAVLQMGPLKMSGFLAWVGWIFVHILLLIGFKNRLFVLIDWFWSYVTYRRGARLITHTDAGQLQVPAAQVKEAGPEKSYPGSP